MPKNDNPHALRLTAAIRGQLGDDAAAAFAEQHPLSKSADADRKFCWAQDVCTALSEGIPQEAAFAIRRACRCGDGKMMAKEISSCISKAGNLPDGCQLFSQKNKYAFLEYVGEHELLFGYHACVCSCVKRADGILPLLWCECSAGYAEEMFRQVLGHSAQVTLLGSVKSGSSRCTFRIRW